MHSCANDCLPPAGQQPIVATPNASCAACWTNLDTFPGDTYQQPWYASGADAAGKNWLPPYADGPARRLGARQALNALLMLGVLRPSIEWLLECKQARVWRDWTRHHDSADWDRLLEPLRTPLINVDQSYLTAATGNYPETAI